MRKYYFLLIFSFVLFSGVLVSADSKEDIVFPVAELGNCKNETECGVYCDKPENMEPCLAFAEEHNLIPEEDIEIGRKVLAVGQTAGPGGCKGTAECGEYCDDINHIQECVAFAEQHGLMSGKELEEAKKVAQAFEKGITPPNNCRSKEECDTYCSQPANIRECITFAKEAGLMPPEELEEADKVLAAIDKGVMPPPCGGRDACDEYCSEPEHLDECITFAEAAGFMSAEEAAMIRRTGGVGPGGCRGKDECEAFCEDPVNMGPCVDFAVENGFMSPEESEQARKMMAAGFTSGPGGCRGQEECETYCDDVSHMPECIDFAEKAGFMSAEDAARGRKMAEIGMSGGPGGCKGEEECRSFCEDPANLDACINFAVQIGDMSPEEADQARQRMSQMQEMEGGMRECLAMPCSEALACLQSVQGEQGGQPSEEGEEREEGEEGGGGPAMGFNADIQVKIESCMQEMQPPEGMIPEGMMPPEGMIPEGMMPPEGFMPSEGTEGLSREEIEGMMQEEARRQQQMLEEQIRQQMEEQIREQMPPTTEMPPQSFLDRVKNFVAGLINR